MTLSDFQREFSGDPVTLVPGTLRGYRKWIVNTDMMLRSHNSMFVWNEQISAVCLGERIAFTASAPAIVTRNDHVAPQPDCACGIYACHDPDDLQVNINSRLLLGAAIAGVIEAGGRIQLGSRGFRAQYARICALWFSLPDVIIRVSSDTPHPGKLTYDSDGWDLPRDWQTQLRRNYPHVTMYRNRDAMLRDYPPISVKELLRSSVVIERDAVDEHPSGAIF